MIRKTIKVSDNNFRKFDDPLGNETPRKYIFYAKTCDVPEGIPMSTNPRDQKLNSTVANAITESLLSNDGQFHLKNRGIMVVCTVESPILATKRAAPSARVNSA